MIAIQLTEIITKDGLIHQGIFSPSSQTKKSAILWVHGLSGTFYGSMRILEAMVGVCRDNDCGFAIFNNRGHDSISSIPIIDTQNLKGYGHVNGGAGYEVFTESVQDIEAGITFLEDQGYSDIILIGHSTGANKVCYYAATQADTRVKKIVLASPVSDRLDTVRDPKILEQQLVEMDHFIQIGKGDEVMSGYNFFPITPKRFLSLYTPHSVEDQFDYGDADPQMTHFSQITLPIAVILGDADEYLDRPAKDVLTVFAAKKKTLEYTEILLPNVTHNYKDAEKNVAKAIVDWIKGKSYGENRIQPI